MRLFFIEDISNFNIFYDLEYIPKELVEIYYILSFGYYSKNFMKRIKMSKHLKFIEINSMLMSIMIVF